MHHPRSHVSIALAAAIYALSACGPVAADVGNTATGRDTICPSAPTSSGRLDCAHLPLGDLRYSTEGPRKGTIFLCRAPRRSHPVVGYAPWLDGDTWNAYAKLAVRGRASWNGAFTEHIAGDTRTIVADGVPTAPATTGAFPISPSDPAFAYDRNPNSIASYDIDLSLPANPSVAEQPGCLHGGAIGIATDGVAIYDAFDAAGYDGVAHEVQDACHGHPDRSSTYHYHGWLQTCVRDDGSATRDSSLLGYALDGFGIYGPWYHGKILTSADLDVCHGITSPVRWNGRVVRIYHYVSTYDFPYTLGCYRGSVGG
ncbi:MAG: YHYH protein [bacterium]|nr:YHYH protein [bacterium]